MLKTLQMSLVLSSKYKKGNMKTTDITKDVKYSSCDHCGHTDDYSSDGYHKVITICLYKEISGDDFSW